MSTKTAIETVYEAPEASTIYDRAQEYMREKGLGFCFLESGEMITADGI